MEFVDLVSSSSLPESSTAVSLPLFILGGAFYPQGISYLNVFEMKYRTMMFDISRGDDTFGYIYSDAGRIASVGTLCKVTNRQLLEDGRQFIAFEGVSRFKVRRILKTLPYVVAEVEPNLEDELPMDPQEAVKLELDAYDSLKYYMRLMKSHPNTKVRLSLLTRSHSLKDLVITPAAKDCRPSPGAAGDLQSLRQRMSRFSFSLANMIQMTSGRYCGIAHLAHSLSVRESQLLLQTTDVTQRLGAEKAILSEASELVADKLVSSGVLSADKRDELKMRSLTSPFDEDILPADAEASVSTGEKDEWDISNIE